MLVSKPPLVVGRNGDLKIANLVVGSIHIICDWCNLVPFISQLINKCNQHPAIKGFLKNVDETIAFVGENLHGQRVLIKAYQNVPNNIGRQPSCPELLKFPDSAFYPLFVLAKEQEGIKEFPNGFEHRLQTTFQKLIQILYHNNFFM